jgi:hypothetical protein
MIMTARRRSPAAAVLVTTTAVVHLLLVSLCHGFLPLDSLHHHHYHSRSAAPDRRTSCSLVLTAIAAGDRPARRRGPPQQRPQSSSSSSSPPKEDRPPAYQVIEREDEYEIIASAAASSSSSSDGSTDGTNCRTVALKRGSVVKIVIGETNRKAWKKRRRSNSPLLIGCTIVSMDSLAAVRSNVLSLLRSHSRVNVNLLLSRYRQAFREPLSPAVALGLEEDEEDNHATPEQLLQQLFKNPKYKVNVVQKNDVWYLESYRYKQTESEVTPVLEFNDDWQHTGTLAGGTPVSAALRVVNNNNNHQHNINDDTNNENGNDDLLPAAGTEVYAVVWDFEPEGDAGFPLLTLSLNPPSEIVSSSNRNPSSSSSKNAIGVAEKALNIGHPLRGVVTRGARKGVVVECLLGGFGQKKQTTIRGVLLYRDARFPTGEEAHSEHGDDDDNDDDNKKARYNFKQQRNRNRKSKSGDDDDDDDEEQDLDNYNEKESTIEDLFNMDDDDDDDEDYDDDDDDGELTDIFRLRENESEEDLTNLFTQNEDGSVSFSNPETGMMETIPALPVYEKDEDVDLPSNDYQKIDDANFNYSIKKKTVADGGNDEESSSSSSLQGKKVPPAMPKYHYLRVDVGDQVDVFVKSHSPRDRRLSLTMDPSIKSLPKKQRRQLDTANKRTERLIQRLGGIRAIRSLRGQECDGIVKATSNMGDRTRLYVQPMNHNDSNNDDEVADDDNNVKNLPVGVATCSDPDLMELLQQGDSVRVRLEGLDEQRGQLAMVVLERIDRRSSVLRTSTTAPPLQP